MESPARLSTFFHETYERLFMADARPKTFYAYDQSVRLWTTITGDPELPCGQAVMAAFKVEALKRCAASTVNKHLRQLNAILAKCGPPGPGNRDALGIVDRVPWTKPLRTDEPAPREVEDETIDAIFNACHAARYPRRLDHAEWWQALVCFAITTGTRRAAVLATRWRDIDLAKRTARVPAAGDKCHRTRTKPLHPETINRILGIRRAADELLFPWDASEKTWYRTWDEIQDAAAIADPDRIRFHDLKRYAGTRYADAGPWVVQKMLDHASIDTSRFYVNADTACRRAVEAFPMPNCFKGPNDAPHDHAQSR